MNPKKYGADKRYLVTNIKERNYYLSLTARLEKLILVTLFFKKRSKEELLYSQANLLRQFFYNIVVLLCGWILVPSFFCKCLTFSIFRQSECPLAVLIMRERKAKSGLNLKQRIQWVLRRHGYISMIDIMKERVKGLSRRNSLTNSNLEK